MRKRNRYQDRHQAQKLTGVPSDTKKGRGSWKKRHSKRLSIALSIRDDAEEWIQSHGWELSINNAGHHWVIKADLFIAEWWPSSAKLVFNKNFKHGIHTHDWSQVRAMLLIHDREGGAA